MGANITIGLDATGQPTITDGVNSYTKHPGSLEGLLMMRTVARSPESATQKFRRLLARAEASNAISNTPLSPPSAWAGSTAYVAGQVRTNGGYQYICRTAGTSAASGGPTGTGSTLITDGTAKWYYYGIPVASTSVNCPTVTENGGSGVPGALTKSYLLTAAYNAANSYPFRFTGGVPTFDSTHTHWNGYTFPSVTAMNGGNVVTAVPPVNGLTANRWAVSFMTDSAKMCIRWGGSVPYRLLIDDTYVSLSAISAVVSGGSSYTIIDFTAAGGQRPRKITLEGGANSSFYGVYVSPTEQVWAPSKFDVIRAIFTGDSHLAGGNSYPMIYNDDWGAVASKLLGWQDYWNCALGGTGYIATTNGTQYNLMGRLNDVIANNPDIVVVGAGSNDENQPSGQIAAVAAQYYKALRLGLPNTPIVVTGDNPAAGGPSALSLACESALLSAFTTWADNNSWFIPVSNDPVQAWYSGTGYVTSQNSSGNSDIYIGEDGTHENDMGMNYYARRFVAAMKNIIASMN